MIIQYSGGLRPFLAKCCCRQNDSLLSKLHLWPIRNYFSRTCFRENLSSHFNYSLNLGFNCHKCFVPWFCILFTYQTSTAVIPVSLLSPKPGAGFYSISNMHACVASTFSGTVHGRSQVAFRILGPIIPTSNYWLTARQVSSGPSNTGGILTEKELFRDGMLDCITPLDC